MSIDEKDITAIANKMVELLGENPPPFWLKAEEHYKDHLRLQWFLRWWDYAAKTVGTIVIVGVLGILLYILTFGKFKAF